MTNPPGLSGHTPVAGEGITEVTVTANPGKNFCSSGISLKVVFPAPRSYADALPAIYDAWASVEQDALAFVTSLAGKKDAALAAEATANAQAAVQPAPAPAPAPVQQAPAQQAPAPAPVPAPAPTGGVELRSGRTKNGKPFKYVPSSVADGARLADGVRKAAAEQGLPGDQLFVSDKRQFLEKGDSAPAAAIIQPKRGSQLEGIAGENSALGFVYFNDDGSINLSLSKDGNAAVTSIAAGVLQQQLGATPVPAPPAAHDLPF